MLCCSKSVQAARHRHAQPDRNRSANTDSSGCAHEEAQHAYCMCRGSYSRTLNLPNLWLRHWTSLRNRDRSRNNALQVNSNADLSVDPAL